METAVGVVCVLGRLGVSITVSTVGNFLILPIGSWDLHIGALP